MRLRDRVIRIFTGDPISVGLDIGNHSVKIVCIRHALSGPVLLGAGIHVFKDPIVSDGQIKNREELLKAIISLINKVPTKKVKKVNFSLSWSYGVIADRIRIKSSKVESDEELILLEADRHSPFDVDDIQLDYKILHKNQTTGDMEVLLVAAKLEIVQPYIDLIEDASLVPVNADVDSFAIVNAYLFASPPEMLSQIVCIVNIGENVSNLTFIKDGAYHSTRVVESGGAYIIESLQRELNVDKSEAISILKGRSHNNEDEEVIARCIEAGAEELSIGIDLAFSYFQTMEGSMQVQKIVLCGGGASIDGLTELFKERHCIPVSILDPLGTIEYDKKKFLTPIPKEIGTALSVATGLALRTF